MAAAAASADVAAAAEAVAAAAEAVEAAAEAAETAASEHEIAGIAVSNCGSSADTVPAPVPVALYNRMHAKYKNMHNYDFIQHYVRIDYIIQHYVQWNLYNPDTCGPG